MHYIKTRITFSMVLSVLIALLVVGGVSVISSYSSAMKSAEENMKEIAEISACRTEWELSSYLFIAKDTGCDPRLSDKSASIDELKKIIQERIDYYGFADGILIGSDGKGIDGADYSSKEFFKKAMQGESYISAPTIAGANRFITTIISAPVWESGVIGGKISGCVYFVPDEEFLNDIMRSINFSENSAAYIIDANGNTIADVDSDLIRDGENIEALAAADTSGQEGFATLAVTHEKMRNGETGFTDYKLHGVRKFIGYAPIDETDGWAIAVYAPSNDFLSNTYSSIIFTIIIILIFCVGVTINSTMIGKKIGKPIELCAERIEKLSQGDLTSPVPKITTKDETGVLAEKTQFIVQNLNSVINDIGHILNCMADGDFSVSCQNNDNIYLGDFKPLLESVRKIHTTLNQTMYQINMSSDQVSSGSDQVSCGAQSLAQGATEQAASVEELASTIHTISEHVADNTVRCENGKSIVDETVDFINNATSNMKKLTVAMGEISGSANEIGKIIKAIEDIAFQTNILALNAAVEAARAGAAGKGFAVVADEVRNLASKSAEAAKETNVLIERAIAAVENGTNITATTAEAVLNVEEHSQTVKEIVAQIASASTAQSEMVNQVTIGIGQISSVVQTNSATAEESAAASEELSGQAATLKNLVNSFKLS